MLSIQTLDQQLKTRHEFRNLKLFVDRRKTTTAYLKLIADNLSLLEFDQCLHGRIFIQTKFILQEAGAKKPVLRNLTYNACGPSEVVPEPSSFSDAVSKNTSIATATACLVSVMFLLRGGL